MDLRQRLQPQLDRWAGELPGRAEEPEAHSEESGQAREEADFA